MLGELCGQDINVADSDVVSLAGKFSASCLVSRIEEWSRIPVSGNDAGVLAAASNSH